MKSNCCPPLQSRPQLKQNDSSAKPSASVYFCPARPGQGTPKKSALQPARHEAFSTCAKTGRLYDSKILVLTSNSFIFVATHLRSTGWRSREQQPKIAKIVSLIITRLSPNPKNGINQLLAKSPAGTARRAVRRRLGEASLPRTLDASALADWKKDLQIFGAGRKSRKDLRWS